MFNFSPFDNETEFSDSFFLHFTGLYLAEPKSLLLLSYEQQEIHVLAFFHMPFSDLRANLDKSSSGMLYTDSSFHHFLPPRIACSFKVFITDLGTVGVCMGSGLYVSVSLVAS